MFHTHEQVDVTGVELKTNLLNAFLIDDDTTLLATTKEFLVLDSEYKVKNRLIYREDLFNQDYNDRGISLCCTPAKTAVGNAFMISFTYGDTIDKKLRSDNKTMGSYEEGKANVIHHFSN